MPKFFLVKELEIMDDLTATNDVVLASLGGAPRPPKDVSKDDNGFRKKF